MNNYSTGSDGSKLQHSLVVSCSILGTFSPIIVLGNLFTIVIFSRKKSGSNSAHILLINLAVADILIGAISIPLYIYIICSGQKWWSSNNLLNIYLTYIANDILASFASIFCLVCIALERLHAIKWPIKHRLTTKRAYYHCLALIWFTSGLITALCFVVKSLTKAYIFVISFGLSLLLILAANITLWYTVKNCKVNSDKRQSSRKTKNEMKLVMTLILVSLVFVLTWVPFQLIQAIFTLCVSCRYLFPSSLIQAAKIMHYANSMANPILYGFRIKEFRNEFFEIILFKKSNEETRV